MSRTHETTGQTQENTIARLNEVRPQTSTVTARFRALAGNHSLTVAAPIGMVAALIGTVVAPTGGATRRRSCAMRDPLAVEKRPVTKRLHDSTEFCGRR